MAIPFETDGLPGTQTLLVPNLKEGGLDWEERLYRFQETYQLRKVGLGLSNTPFGCFLIRDKHKHPLLTPIQFEGKLTKIEAYNHPKILCGGCAASNPPLVSLKPAENYSCSNCNFLISRIGTPIKDKTRGPFIVNRDSNLVGDSPLQRYPNIFEPLSDVLKQVGILSAATGLLITAYVVGFSLIQPEMVIDPKRIAILGAIAVIGSLALPAAQVIDRFEAFGPIKNPDNIVVLAN